MRGIKALRQITSGIVLVSALTVSSVASGMDVSRLDVSIGAGWAFSKDTVFSDENCASISPTAYFGCGAGSDGRRLGAYGDFGDTAVVDVGIGYTVNDWLHTELLLAYRHGVTLDFSRPGKPTDNAFIEAFNGRFRAEWLNAHWFLSLADAREKMEIWRRYYNPVS